MSEETRALIVLSGGRSSRFGADKGLSVFNGKPLVASTIDALHEMVDQVIVQVAQEMASAYGQALGDTACIFEDRQQFSGPLFGLRDAARHSDAEIILVAPCDRPFITPRIYSLLLEKLCHHDAAMPFVKGFHEPMTGVYRRDPLLRAIDTEVKSGGRKLSGIIRHLDVISLLDIELERHGVNERAFEDLNQPPDSN